MYPKRFLRLLPLVLCVSILCPAMTVLALPDDVKQQIEVAASSGQLLLNDGWSTIKGKPELPARVTQGTMQISGTEIRVFTKNDELQTVIASGSPARFQQQLTLGQEPAKANAKTINFDNKTRLLILDTNVELNQGGKVVVGDHVEYNIDTGAASASGKDGEQAHITIPPRKGKP
jgi:lipopolysaccharide export system protein LptA